MTKDRTIQRLRQLVAAGQAAQEAVDGACRVAQLRERRKVERIERCEVSAHPDDKEKIRRYAARLLARRGLA